MRCPIPSAPQRVGQVDCDLPTPDQPDSSLHILMTVLLLTDSVQEIMNKSLNNWLIFIKKKLATPLKKILTLQKPSGDVAQLRSWLRRQEQANHHLQPPSPAHSAIVSSVLGLNSQPPGHPWLISPPPGWLNGLRWPRKMNNKQQAIIDTFSTNPCLKTKRHHAYIMHALLLFNGRKSFHEAHLRHFGPFS